MQYKKRRLIKIKIKDYESITFKVEKGLKKPEDYLKTNGIKSIFAKLFKKRKSFIDNKTGREIFLNIKIFLEKKISHSQKIKAKIIKKIINQ